jgi:hypothetical protein
MGTGTKSVTHAGMGMGTGIFSNRGYGDEDCSTLPIPYPLPSLIMLAQVILFLGCIMFLDIYGRFVDHTSLESCLWISNLRCFKSSVTNGLSVGLRSLHCPPSNYSYPLCLPSCITLHETFWIWMEGPLDHDDFYGVHIGVASLQGGEYLPHRDKLGARISSSGIVHWMMALPLAWLIAHWKKYI